MAKKIKVLKKNLPAEMVEEILLNLPLKSLVRFSSVSKEWNSMILDSWFVKRYRRGGRGGGRERIAFHRCNRKRSRVPFMCLPTTCRTRSTSNFISSESTESVVCPFAADSPVIILAFCDDMWLACEYCHYATAKSDEDKALFLWNPSMGTHKKLPHKPSISPSPLHSFVYGLGYESVEDDYKILKLRGLSISIHDDDCGSGSAELYSLRSDSWRDIPYCNISVHKNQGQLVFVRGNLHWLLSSGAISSFNLSTEKFGEVAAQPNYSTTREVSNLTALSGTLCVILNNYDDLSCMSLWDQKCVVWVMEDYGIASSWNIKCSIPCIQIQPVYFIVSNVMPVHFYQNGEILLRVKDGDGITKLYIYNKDEKLRMIKGRKDYFVVDGIVYVDSLVNPGMISYQYV